LFVVVCAGVQCVLFVHAVSLVSLPVPALETFEVLRSQARSSGASLEASTAVGYPPIYAGKGSKILHILV